MTIPCTWFAVPSYVYQNGGNIINRIQAFFIVIIAASLLIGLASLSCKSTDKKNGGVSTSLFLPSELDIRTKAGDEFTYISGESTENHIYIGSRNKPVRTKWRYRVVDNGGTYEAEVEVSAITHNSYKECLRVEGYPDREIYYEYGAEEPNYDTVSLYEEYDVGGIRKTERYDPPRRHFPSDGILRPGDSWVAEKCSIIKTNLSYRERFEDKSKFDEIRYSVDRIERVTTPAGDNISAIVIERDDAGNPISEKAISDIGTVAITEFSPDGVVIERWVLIDFKLSKKVIITDGKLK